MKKITGRNFSQVLGVPNNSWYFYVYSVIHTDLYLLIKEELSEPLASNLAQFYGRL